MRPSEMSLKGSGMPLIRLTTESASRTCDKASISQVRFGKIKSDTFKFRSSRSRFKLVRSKREVWAHQLSTPERMDRPFPTFQRMPFRIMCLSARMCLQIIELLGLAVASKKEVEWQYFVRIILVHKLLEKDGALSTLVRRHANSDL